MSARIEDTLTLAPVVPVVVVDDAADAVPLATALVAGGLPEIEVTLRTPAALDAIERIADEVPGAVVGAGTVTSAFHAADAVAAGARFLVSPGATPALLETMRDSGVPFLPGAATPSDVIALLERDVAVAKLFPAEAVGGVRMLRALAGPFPAMRFCPTGGIDLALAPGYLALPNVVCVGGSWMLPAAAVRERDWATVQSLARAAAALGSPAGAAAPVPAPG
jgi:2-dehydro-3-deoxyphosphogluconate aldolase/(4S)-4-hydroxy-2-oxoglutarate aldolase